MTSSCEPTILCVASFFKGNDFIRECKRSGARVVLLTREKLLQADWARESLSDVIAIPGKSSVQAYLAAAAHIARQQRVSHVVALEEYDIVTAAHIREHLAVPGMGATIARYFQDKLAMRAKACEVGILQPEFVPLVNYESIAEFLTQTSPPWMLKPRIGASSMGMRKLQRPEEVWSSIAELDERAAFHETSTFNLLEQYIPGNVYHVDSLVQEAQVRFANVQRYGAPPFQVSHFGGVACSHTVQQGSHEERTLIAMNDDLLQGFGFKQGVTHAEFIKSNNGQFYFLEVAARVGGAYTAETIEAATGVNLWREWARIELTTPGQPYLLSQPRSEYAGIVVSLARQERPCTSCYNDAEIVYRISKPWHVGLIVRSPDYRSVMNLLNEYSRRFREDFTAVAPPEDTAERYL